MSDLESLERRMDVIERKLDSVLDKQTPRDFFEEPVRRVRSGTARIFFGLLLLFLGVLWLGRSYGIDWLQRVDTWPIIVIALGLFIIFGDRRR